MNIKDDLKSLADPERAKNSMWFFKTGKGEYGEGDKFIGVKVPDQRKIAKKYYKEVSVEDAFDLLKSEIHEHRLTALFVLVYKFEKASEAERVKVAKLYLKNAKWVNNWDLVDSSAPYIVGQYLADHAEERKILYEFASSKNIWKRRIAVLAAFRFIANCDFEDFLKIAKILLRDSHDLIHKAVGWGLREVGKRDSKVEEDFLDNHYKDMPRTMLRYAIEKFNEEKRQSYLKGTRSV